MDATARDIDQDRQLARDWVARAGAKVARTRQRLDQDTDQLRQAIITAMQTGAMSEAEAARVANVSRTTVRSWRGK